LEELRAEDDDPSTLASKVADREFFGPNHPYSLPVGGTINTVSAIGLADVKAAYATLGPSNASIYASGSLASSQMKALLDRYFGTWSKRTSGIRAAEYPAPPSTPRLIVVDKPGAVQSVIRIMMPTVPFQSPERHALTELGLAFGGTFTSRINRNLREQKGYTYGAGLRYAFSQPVSYIVASTSVRADVTGASLKEFITEFSKIKTGDLTEDEASIARNTLRTSFIDSTSTRQGIIATAIAYRENGIPFNQVDAELSRFGAIDLGKLNSVAPSALPFDHALIVVVGDKVEILKQIDGLGLPNPEVLKG
jgi:zinc protease